MVNAEEFEQANVRAMQCRETNPVAISARYDEALRRVVIAFSTGIELSFIPQDAQGLEAAQPADLAHIEISPSGLGLHFPTLDADLYLPALLEGFLGSRQWMAAQLGKQGGRATTSTAKADAAHANGRCGGRPKTASII